MRTITVTLSDIRIRRLIIDAEAQIVSIAYDLLDDQGSYRHGEASRKYGPAVQIM